MEPQRWRLVITAVSASLATFGVVTAYQTMSHRKKRRELDLDAARSLARSEALLQSAPLEDQIEKWRAGSSSFTSSQVSNVYDEGLIREQLARNYAFFGDEAMSRVRGGHVVVVGCGGVGSYAALMLARSGVSKIRLIDFDYVTLSSLNRHATALLSDVGTPKVTCVERTIRQVAKWVHVDARIEIWRKDEGGGQLLEGADWVVGELCDRCETA
jgi:tRNA threonylcarbamoyladenosine dehydratase